PVVPPRVKYAMPPLGLTLKPVIPALAAWGEDYVFCSPEGRELRLASDGLRAQVAALEA
ncbi:winged helix-turn-helix transcriptional regulator, partial [Rhizobium leguminosarum]|uniref:winged helix-turn-helix transcriptional regulator n=1 Tax=Rhizobium leguminosarum TaxID=384 RepID=UPI003F9B406D